MVFEAKHTDSDRIEQTAIRFSKCSPARLLWSPRWLRWILERAVAISLLSMCSELWVYGIDNPSEGMKAEIEYAKEHGILVRDAVEVYQHTDGEQI